MISRNLLGWSLYIDLTVVDGIILTVSFHCSVISYYIIYRGFRCSYYVVKECYGISCYVICRRNRDISNAVHGVASLTPHIWEISICYTDFIINTLCKPSYMQSIYLVSCKIMLWKWATFNFYIIAVCITWVYLIKTGDCRLPCQGIRVFIFLFSGKLFLKCITCNINCSIYTVCYAVLLYRCHIIICINQLIQLWRICCICKYDFWLILLNLNPWCAISKIKLTWIFYKFRRKIDRIWYTCVIYWQITLFNIPYFHVILLKDVWHCHSGKILFPVWIYCYCPGNSWLISGQFTGFAYRCSWFSWIVPCGAVDILMFMMWLIFYINTISIIYL